MKGSTSQSHMGQPLVAVLNTYLPTPLPLTPPPYSVCFAEPLCLELKLSAAASHLEGIALALRIVEISQAGELADVLGSNVLLLPTSSTKASQATRSRTHTQADNSKAGGQTKLCTLCCCNLTSQLSCPDQHKHQAPHCHKATGGSCCHMFRCLPQADM